MGDRKTSIHLISNLISNPSSPHRHACQGSRTRRSYSLKKHICLYTSLTIHGVRTTANPLICLKGHISALYKPRKAYGKHVFSRPALREEPPNASADTTHAAEACKVAGQLIHIRKYSRCLTTRYPTQRSRRHLPPSQWQLRAVCPT